MIGLAALAILAATSMKPAVLQPDSFKHYIDRFNSEDRNATDEKLSILNDRAWPFLRENIPLFECPDKQIEETYYYRWWTYRKHLTETPAGWIVTEFLPKVGWSGIYNSISCAAGHHLYEGRWLHDPKYMEQYARFWTLPEAEPRRYSFWFADSVRALSLVTGDKSLAWRLLPNLVANYMAWERSNRDSNGLFQQVDGVDGMEFSLGGSGHRPSISSYLYGDAKAIAAIAEEEGDIDIAAKFRDEAKRLKRLVEEKLWNPADSFFETLPYGPSTTFTGVREQVGFTPWYFGLPDARFEIAWRQLLDPQGFAAPFGPTTVERRARGFMHPEDHDCLWNGPSWPYATTQTLVAVANLLNERGEKVVSKLDYLNLLTGYSRSQQKGGRPWIAEDLDADSGKWIVDLPRSTCYNHSGFADLIITGLAGIRPSPDEWVKVNPLLPNHSWKWFCLDSVSYHGHSVCVLWDLDGSHYGKGKGLSLFVDGRQVANRSDLGELRAPVPKSESLKQPIKASGWTKHPGPVLGGALGTCFDISVLQHDGEFNMAFSWRPKASIASVTSKDGVHWSEPRILIKPTKNGWEDDVNRPSVVFQNGAYHMWYTGQFNGHSAIGYATSPDGIDWKRIKKPVLEADRPWEKVAVMCPSVLWDEADHEFRMWYSGGEQYEPDAIGYAVSRDGHHWQKRDVPVFEADPKNWWESYKVTACQVTHRNGWYLMFYIGFRDIDHAQIGVARSRDGVTGWERLPSNPIISPTVDGWDADACYKPFAIFDESTKKWMLWYNGRHGGLEQIGLATKSGLDLGFPR